MENIKKHFSLFPPKIRSALEGFSRWDSICEIRLRKDLPLSLTSYGENILIDHWGKRCGIKDAITASSKDLNFILGSFCRGSVYRYFESLNQGYAVNEDGWRMGVFGEKKVMTSFLPEEINAINLRIPRFIDSAADDLIAHLRSDGIKSTLIFSPPGEGKTTLLRALAQKLALGSWGKPLRVCVIDEKEELFPKGYRSKGLIDLLSGYEKKEGIEMAVRLFSPEVILCDEVGNEKEVNAILSSCTGGCIVFASCHAAGLDDAKEIGTLKPLIQSGLFHRAVTLKRKKADFYERTLVFEDII